MLQVIDEYPLERQHARFPIHQRQEPQAKGRLHRREGKEPRQHLTRFDCAGHLDAQPHSLPVRFVPQVGDALDPSLAHQLGDPFDEACLVHLVGQLGDDDAAAVAAHLLNVHLGLDGEPPAPQRIRILNQIHPVAVVVLAGIAVDDATGGKVRTQDKLRQVLDRDVVQLVVMVDEVDQCVAHLAQVMGRDIGGHAYGDAGSAVYQQVGQQPPGARQVR